MKIRFNKSRPPESFEAGIDPLTKVDGGYLVTIRYYDNDHNMQTVDLVFKDSEAVEIASKMNDFKMFIGGK